MNKCVRERIKELNYGLRVWPTENINNKVDGEVFFLKHDWFLAISTLTKMKRYGGHQISNSIFHINKYLMAIKSLAM